MVLPVLWGWSSRYLQCSPFWVIGYRPPNRTAQTSELACTLVQGVPHICSGLHVAWSLPGPLEAGK